AARQRRAQTSKILACFQPPHTGVVLAHPPAHGASHRLLVLQGVPARPTHVNERHGLGGSRRRRNTGAVRAREAVKRLPRSAEPSRHWRLHTHRRDRPTLPRSVRHPPTRPDTTEPSRTLPNDHQILPHQRLRLCLPYGTDARPPHTNNN